MPDTGAAGLAPTVARLNEADATAWGRAARRGDFEEAWRCSDRIRARTANRGDPSVPRHLQQIWDGTPLEGRRVLVRCYHGLGDTIQCARYLPALRAIARDVIVWAQPRVVPLVRTVSDGLAVLPLHDGAPDVDYDVDIEIMELAYAFRTTLQTIPATVPYLHVPGIAGDDAGRVGACTIGIAWRAGGWNPERSIDFTLLTPWFDDIGLDVRWRSLQFDGRDGERHPRLQAFEEKNLFDTAARMRAMALVISIDSMPAHLAGALGVPVWTLLPHDADWRWLERRADSPWYPTMRLFRQARQGDWEGVLGEVHQVLGKALNHQPHHGHRGHPPCFTSRGIRISGQE
jgi:hypothetical protein